MTKRIPIFNGVLGLNIKEHPVKLHQTNEGLIELSEAINIDISNRFNIK